MWIGDHLYIHFLCLLYSHLGLLEPIPVVPVLARARDTLDRSAGHRRAGWEPINNSLHF